MSGIYIPDMEMPSGCTDCPVWAVLRCQSEINLPTRPRDCPLIPVPDHGRLIDADDEIEVWDVCGIEGVFRRSKTTVSKFLLGHCIEQIPPTVIPADKEESNRGLLV